MPNFFQRGLRALQEAQQARADFWLLQNMSDKELRDVGISRGQIREFTYGEKSNRKTT